MQGRHAARALRTVTSPRAPQLGLAALDGLLPVVLHVMPNFVRSTDKARQGKLVLSADGDWLSGAASCRRRIPA